MKRIVIVLILITLAVLPLTAAPPQQERPVLLPDAFGGWQRSSSQGGADTAAADPIYADLLKEYGFTDYESASYAKPDRKLTIKAARFNDASGAYGAFTFYKTPEMQTERIGDQGASNNTHVLFYRANVLVTADFDRVTPMSAAELRELAADLPLPSGSARNLPSLPQYLPRQGYVRNSVKYVMGPVALASVEAPITAPMVGFGSGAEVAKAQYKSGEGTATMVLVSYPTPAIAADRLRVIESAHPQDASGTAPLFLTKRTGPLIAVVTGAISPREAKALLASVNYDADVTWNENTFLGKRDNVGSLLVGVIVLIGVILGLSLVAGVAFGGIRIVLKRLFPDKVFDRSQDVEIIELKLRG